MVPRDPWANSVVGFHIGNFDKLTFGGHNNPRSGFLIPENPWYDTLYINFGQGAQKLDSQYGWLRPFWIYANCKCCPYSCQFGNQAEFAQGPLGNTNQEGKKNFIVPTIARLVYKSYMEVSTGSYRITIRKVPCWYYYLNEFVQTLMEDRFRVRSKWRSNEYTLYNSGLNIPNDL